jgi:hypothetical protein
VDIQRFVQDQFENDDRIIEKSLKDNRYLEIVDSLIEKANGVFLWVTFTVQQILSGLGNNHSLLQLQEELDQLPSGLEAVFKKGFVSIHKSDQVRASRHFTLMTMSIGTGIRMTVAVWIPSKCGSTSCWHVASRRLARHQFCVDNLLWPSATT